MISSKLLGREILKSKFQVVLFILCIILSVSTYVALEGFNNSVNNFIESDSKELVGGDLIVEENRPFSPELTAAILEVEQDPRVETVYMYDTTTITYFQEKNTSLFTELRIVGNLYPHYGEVELLSGGDISDKLKAGYVVVEQGVLERLEAEIGDTISIGSANLIISDVLLKEPNQPLNIFSLGPRVLVSTDDLEAIDLIGDRSRVEYSVLFKIEDGQALGENFIKLESAAQEREDVDTFSTKQTGISRFIDNFTFFIQVVLFFAIVLAGVGMSLTVTVYIREKRETIAIMKAIGKKNLDITMHYLLTIFMLAVIGIILGLLVGVYMQTLIPELFADIIDEEIKFILSWTAIAKGAFLGLFVVIIFCLIPIRSLKDISPVAIFRKDDSSNNKKTKEFYVLLILVFALFFWFAYSEFNNLFFTVGFTFGFVFFFGFIYLLSYYILKFLYSIKNRFSLPIKQSISSLFRPGNNTVLIVTIFTMALSVIFAVLVLESNLQNQFVTSYPEDSPNVFFIDLRADQIDEFSALFDFELDYFPVIRGRILEINDQPLEEYPFGRDGDVRRTFSLTYGTKLFETETLAQSTNPGELFEENWDKEVVQVSVIDEIYEQIEVGLGDRITFLIQGVELEAEVVSMRDRKEQGFEPYFYFNFEPSVLESAPQTIFTSARLDPDEITSKQNEIVQKFPNISTINLNSVLETIIGIIEKLSAIIKFFMLFSVISGILILVSSIIASSIERTKESIFYKVLGGDKSFIRKVFFSEYFILGFLSSFFSLFISNFAVFWIVKFIFEFDFYLDLGLLIMGFLATVVMVVFIGFMFTRKIISKKPIEYLREE